MTKCQTISKKIGAEINKKPLKPDCKANSKTLNAKVNQNVDVRWKDRRTVNMNP